MSENGEIYTAGKNFTLPSAVTALTNSTSASSRMTKGGLYQDGGAWGRKEVFSRNLLTFTHLLGVCLCALDWRPEDGLYQFSAEWRRGED